MFEGFVEQRQETGLWRRLVAVLLSTGVHFGIVGLLLFVSVLLTQKEAEEEVPVVFYNAPVAPPPPPPPPAATRQPKTVKKDKPKETKIVQPIQEKLKPVEVKPQPESMPESLPEEEEEEEDTGPVGVVGGVIGGVEGGVLGGVVGGKLGGQLGAPLEEAPVRMKKGMIPPKPVPGTQRDPEYPRALREARVEGKVMLLIAVKSNGSVGEVKVQSGNPALAQAAVTAVKRWKFEPAIYDGRPIAVWLPYPFVFRLDK